MKRKDGLRLLPDEATLEEAERVFDRLVTSASLPIISRSECNLGISGDRSVKSHRSSRKGLFACLA